MKTNIFKKISGQGLKIAIVRSRFNEKVTDGLKQGALKGLKIAGVLEKDIEVFEVPGSFEIPLFCKKLISLNRFDGILAVGAVIKGETAHFEWISKAVTDGISKLMMENSFPIAFSVLTAYNLKQAEERSKDDENNKGYEASLALIEMIQGLKNLK